ncbi:MAG TPA: hypothetical protein VNX68_11440 [Nitrosopumilaceae archaeon]|nr:hypothetical protein [Nitrosopumilaceae archaeon]
MENIFLIINYPTFNPRHYQTELLHAFFKDKIRNFFYLCHRRAGKDLTCWNLLWGAALERVGTYLYLLPLHTQARKVVWRGIIGDGTRFIDMIPRQIIHKINNTEMSVTLLNGSIIQLGGSNNYNALMGTNPVGIVMSEFALHTPLALQYLSPILLENGGFLLAQTTPRGKNHAYHLYQNVVNDSNWFVRKYTVNDTLKLDGKPVITAEEIDKERKRGMSEELIRQEWYLDFNVGIQGAYYTNEIEVAEYEGRLRAFEINPRLPVFTSWDLGVSDPTCIIFFQQEGDYINIVYFIEKTDKGVDYFKHQLDEVAQRFGYRYRHHFAPHDIMKREWGSSARSSLSLAHEAGIHFQRVPDVGVENGIAAVRAIFPLLRIHQTYCQPLIDALREYRREYDEEDKVFKPKPYHNWASHPADALRYLAIVWRQEFTRPDLAQPIKYQSSF